MDFRLLGPVRCEGRNGPISLGPRQQRFVAAVLALEANRIVSVDRLVDLLWPVAPPRTAIHAVQVCVSGLRTAFAEAPEVVVEVTGRGDGYVLRADPLIVDAHRFRALLAEAKDHPDETARVSLLRQALALWSGPALTGVTTDDIRDQLCRGLEESRRLAAEDLFDARLRLGEHRELLDELAGAVAANPLRERLAGQLMLALHRSGERGEALAVYRQTSQRLAEELGIDPGAALRELETAILRDDGRQTRSAAPPAAVVPAQLPAAVTGFAGRLAELRRLDDLVTNPVTKPAAVLITAIGGTAGVGKTALAVFWAHRVAPRYPDGQLYVNLRGFGPSGPPLPAHEAVRGFLEALGVRQDRLPMGPDAQTGLYRSLLAERRMLIVLDNAATAEQVRPLLPGSPGSLVLVTSRAQLTGLVAVETATPLMLDVLSDGEAHELLVNRLGSSRVEAEPEAVEQIIERCARLPLPLAVVAARAAINPQLALAGFAADLRGAARRLDPFTEADPEIDIRAVFSWSYRALSAGTQRLFRLLGLHPGTDISLAAAASVAGLSLEDTRSLIAELIRAHLLSEPEPNRYTSHDLLRAYAAELCHAEDAEDDRAGATTRLLDHYLMSAYACDRLLNPNAGQLTPGAPAAGITMAEPADYDSAMAWFTAEHASLSAVIQATLPGFDAHTWRLARTIATFYSLRSHWDGLAATHQAALVAGRRSGDLDGQAYAHRMLGRVLSRQGRLADAYTHHHAAIDFFARAGDPVGQGHATMDLAWTMGTDDQTRESITHLSRALELFRGAGNPIGEAAALNGIGWSHACLGEFDEALAHCELALAAFQALGEGPGAYDTWDSLGLIHHQRGDYAQATECYERALTGYRGVGDLACEVDTLIRLGDSHQANRSPQPAAEAWGRALQISQELQHPLAEEARRRLSEL